MPRQPYPSDLTDAQWAILEPLVPAAKPGGRPPSHARRELVDAMRDVLRGGIAWRAMPHAYPPWQTVSHSFRLWRREGRWERIHDALRERVRGRAGRHPAPGAAILDSQSVRTTEAGGLAATTGPGSWAAANGTSWSIPAVCCSAWWSIRPTCRTGTGRRWCWTGSPAPTGSRTCARCGPTLATPVAW